LIKLTSTTLIQHGHAEQRDKTDRSREVQVHTTYPGRRDASGEGERDITDDEQCLHKGGEGDIEKNEDQSDNDRDDDHEAASGSLLIFKLSAEFAALYRRKQNQFKLINGLGASQSAITRLENR
jgi:hypothetical protein